jgi:gas vesicle protein
MMLLAQAAETGTDFAKILGIGGPASIGTAILFWLGKMWLDSRKDKREDVKTEREGESQIVATTDALAKLVREQLVDMSAEVKALKMANAEMRERYERDLDKLRERVATLESENERLRARRLRGEE